MINLAGLDTELNRQLAEASLFEFIVQGWHVIEPATDFQDNWHIHAICEHLEAVTNGDIRNLIINIPPRHMKSITTAVAWPAWSWIAKPETRFLVSSYAQALSVRDSRKCRMMIQSDWYQANWGDAFELSGDQNAKMRFDNDKTGFRLAASTGSSITGEGGDFLVVDDIMKAQDALSPVKRAAAIDWWKYTMSTRLNDPKKGGRVIIMQRLHEEDLVGHVLDEMEIGGEQYEKLILPAEFEPESKCFTGIGFEDPRTERNELIWPERSDRETVDKLKVTLGSQGAAAQLQQRPSPKDGDMFHRGWFRFWVPYGQADKFPAQHFTNSDGQIVFFQQAELPPSVRLKGMVQTWDCTFKKKDDSDFVAGHVWAWRDANWFLLDRVHDRMGIKGTMKAIEGMTEAWPNARPIIIEDAANGPAIIEMLKDNIGGILPFTAEQAKEVRAGAAAPYVESGNVYLPHPHVAPWAWDVIEEFVKFPFGKNDDDVDAFSMFAQRQIDKNSRRRRPSASAR